MSSSDTAPVDTRVAHRNITAAERFEHYNNVVMAVIAQYVRLRALHPVASAAIDPDGIGHSDKLTYDAINYICDIERVTTKALENRVDLQAIWFSLALGELADPKLTRETIMRCGRLYSARRIAPWQYWKPNCYPHKRGAAR